MYNVMDKLDNIEGIYNVNSTLLRLLGTAIKLATKPKAQDVMALLGAEDAAMYAVIQDSKDAVWGQKTPLYKCFVELAKIELALARHRPAPPALEPAPESQEPDLTDADKRIVKHYIARCKEQDLHRII